jgi:glutathione-regulated potassium-efflux system ancillary protein KefG
MVSDGDGRRVLILFAHPALQNSRVNRRLLEEVRALPGVTLHDLYEAYPEFDVDVQREQQLLLAHDLVVLQHPFYWYSTPALLKEWQDLVLEHGWAYGQDATALRGKRLMCAITTGGGESAYDSDGLNRFSMAEFLRPIQQTAVLCGMHYLPPFVVHGPHSLGESEIARHAEDYARTILALRDGRVDLEAARRHPRLNWRLADIVRD